MYFEYVTYYKLNHKLSIRNRTNTFVVPIKLLREHTLYNKFRLFMTILQNVYNLINLKLLQFITKVNVSFLWNIGI